MKLRQNSKLVKLFLLAVLFLFAVAACVPDGVYYALVNMDAKGTTEDGVDYDKNDILLMDSMNEVDAIRSWVTVFDGEAYGLNDKKHDISAFSFNDWVEESEPEDEPEPTDAIDEFFANENLYLSFEANRTRVPGITGWVMGNDVVAFLLDTTGPQTVYSYEMFFDGSDVGLSTKAEKIDGLTVLDQNRYGGESSDEITVPNDCIAGVLFISTRGNYRVPNNQGGFLVGDGSDVLAFCAANLGADTAGFWFRLFDGSDAGLKPRNAVNGLDVFTIEEAPGTTEDSGTEEYGVGFFFVSDKPFTAGGGVIGDSQAVFAGGSVEAPSWVEGPVANFNDGSQGPALNGPIDDVVFDEVYNLSIP